MLRILHISDFHFNDPKTNDFDEIAERLRNSVSHQDFDLVVFSGDLVFEGKQKEMFDKAYELLLMPILVDKNLSEERLMLTPGNHDMLRGAEMKDAITLPLSKINDERSLDNFLKDQRQSDLSFDNFTAYNDFIKSKGGDYLLLNNFINARKIEINGKQIGMINLNSAWRCKKSEEDRGNLLFPVDKLSEALRVLGKCDIILVNMHHSLSDFKDFVEQQLDDLIYDKCDILFTGHCHKSRSSTNNGASVGLLHNRASAVYNRKDPISQYGYSIIEYDRYTLHAVVNRFRYVEGVYALISTKHHTIPVDQERWKILEFRKTMRSRERFLSLKADDLFVTGRCVIEDKTTFRQLFSEPVLRPKSLQDYMISKSKGEAVGTETIINSKEDFIVYGQDKTGKTSLLWKILLDTTRDYYELKTIPYYVDCKKLKPSQGKSLIIELKNSLNLNNADTAKTFNEYKLLLLLDNFSFDDNLHANWLKSQLADFPKVRLIVTAEETIVSNDSQKILDNLPLPRHLFIHEITYKEVHQLTCKWPNLTPERRVAVEKRINQVFHQMHIPFNYWTASLFLWIFERTDETNIHNNFELVKYYVEELLNRDSILLDHTLKLQYDDFEAYLGELAYFLYNHEVDSYAVSYNDLVNFTEDYRHRKKKFTETTQNVIGYIMRSGTIYERDENKYTFRLKGVFEYFLAYYMTKDDTFRDCVVDDLKYYLSFGNEIELYAGFRPDDINVVKRVFDQTKRITNPVFSGEKFTAVDSRLIDKLTVRLSVKEIAAIADKTELLSTGNEEDDEILVLAQPFEAKEVTRKRRYDDEIAPDAVNIQKALFILGRVYRNSEVCDKEGLGDEILNFVINGTCNLGFLINEEFEKEVKDEETLKLLKGFRGMLPLVMQAYLYDMMCQKSLSRIFKEKLDELLKNPEGNQYRIFLLASCLLDIDINTYHSYIAKLDKMLKKGALKYSALLKAEMLYTKEEGINAVSRKLLKDFIMKTHSEIFPKSNDPQERVNFLDKRREIHENKMKQLYHPKP